MNVPGRQEWSDVATIKEHQQPPADRRAKTVILPAASRGSLALLTPSLILAQ